MENVKPNVNSVLKSENILQDTLGDKIEALRLKRDALAKVVDRMDHPLRPELVKVNSEYKALIHSLPAPDPAQLERAIMLFNSDKRYTITE